MHCTFCPQKRQLTQNQRIIAAQARELIGLKAARLLPNTPAADLAEVLNEGNSNLNASWLAPKSEIAGLKHAEYLLYYPSRQALRPCEYCGDQQQPAPAYQAVASLCYCPLLLTPAARYAYREPRSLPFLGPQLRYMPDQGLPNYTSSANGHSHGNGPGIRRYPDSSEFDVRPTSNVPRSTPNSTSSANGHSHGNGQGLPNYTTSANGHSPSHGNGHGNGNSTGSANRLSGDASALHSGGQSGGFQQSNGSRQSNGAQQSNISQQSKGPQQSNGSQHSSGGPRGFLFLPESKVPRQK